MELVNVGFGNLVVAGRILGILTPDSAPAKRLVEKAEAQGLLLDVTRGKKRKSILVLDSGHVVLAAFRSATLAARLATPKGGLEDRAEEGE